MNPHVKSLPITPVINKFPVISRHNSPCCFVFFPQPWKSCQFHLQLVLPGVQKSQLSTRPHFFLLTVIHFPAQTTRSKQTSVCSAKTQQFWNNGKSQRLSEVIHLSLFVASPHSLVIDKIGCGLSIIWSLHILICMFQLHTFSYLKCWHIQSWEDYSKA